MPKPDPALLQSRQGRPTEAIGITAGNTRLELEISLSSYDLPSHIWFIYLLHDISERTKVERLKSEFIANVSHELRTPLMSIKGSLELVNAGVLEHRTVKKSGSSRGQNSTKLQDQQVLIKVSDQGAGIPAEFRSRIFQKFAQADGSDSRQRGGTGLGRSICKELMERMHGTIGFDSEEGVGSTFYLMLPFVPATA